MALIDLGSGVKYEATTVGSGTGNYDSFVRIQANDDETGYNTDASNQLDNKDGIWTHSLAINTLSVINVGGIDYYEIRLDLNEVKSGDGPNITLEDLQIFRGPAAGAGAFPAFAGLTNVFNLSGTLALVDTNHGSGTDDYRFLLPTSLFPDSTQFLTLYADFSGSEDGFEEFRAKSQIFTPQPDIGVLKETNGTDDECPFIIVGDTVTWTYTVENNGNVALTNVVLTDDNGTPLNPLDDFNPTYVSGDTNTNNILETTETWIYTATAPAVAGEYHNVATVSGDWASSGQSGTVSGFEEDCYFGADPSISIIKKTNGTDDLCPVIAVGEAVTWTYFVSNTGNVALSNIVISDDNGTPGENPPESDDDFPPDAVLGADLIHNIGDVNNDGILDLTEIWQYTASGTAEEGEYENVATVTGDFTDSADVTHTVDASEDDCYVGVEGPGVRTPGFWSNWTDFWDGDLSVPAQAADDCFPDYDLLRIDSNGDGVIDGSDSGFTNGLYIGDYDRDGVAEAGEDVFFISLTDANNLINASNKQMSDGVVKVGRDVVASWLNYLAGNPIGTVADDGDYSPREAIDDAIDYLQIFGDASNSNANTNDPFDTYAASHGAVKTSSAFWNNDFPGGSVSGAEIHNALDEYNNFGSVNGIGYAHDCETQQFVVLMQGFHYDPDFHIF